jgi:hypothetical protein
MSEQTQGNTLQDILKWELSNLQSREVVTVLFGQNLALGAVIGKITKSIPTTGTRDSGNTGGGTVASVTGGEKTKLGTYTLTCKSLSEGAATVPSAGTPDDGNTGGGSISSVTGGAKVKIGTYTLTCVSYIASPLAAVIEVVDPDGNSLPDAELGAYVSSHLNFTVADGSPVITVGDIWTIEVTEASHNSGVFSVVDPDGNSLPDATVGSAYSNAQINFTISDGSPDFIVGDAFTIEVAEGSGSVKALNIGAVDGSQNAYGFTTAAYDATNGTISGVAIVRDAQIVATDLVWPSTSPAVSNAQKAAALAQLYAKGIVERTEA